MYEDKPCAVIFDVDGVILHLTPAEEGAFFASLDSVFGITGASSDWDSYKIRNDVQIVEELVETHLGRPATPGDINRFTDKYISQIDIGLKTGDIEIKPIDGIRDVLMALTQVENITLGLATANLMSAAKMRLRQAGLNDFFSIGGFAEARGPKRDILSKTISVLTGARQDPVALHQIVYIGDNLVDVDAGLHNGCGLIAFNVDASRHDTLRNAGAGLVLKSHTETVPAIAGLLGREIAI